MPEHSYRILIANWKDRSSIVFLPQVLKEAGCEVHAFAPKANMLTHAQGVDRVYEAPEELSQFKAGLQRHINDAVPRYDWVIPAEDSLLYKLIAYRQEEPWIDPLLPTRKDPGQLKLLLSKSHFLAMANKLGLPIPQSIICTNRANVERYAGPASFPVILKSNLGYNGFGVRVLNSLDELTHYLDAGEKLIYPLILQAYLPGEPGTTWALYDHGQLISWASCLTPYTQINKIRDTSQKRDLILRDIPQVEDYLRKLGDYTGFHGFSGVDFIFDEPRQKIYLLEMHARPVAGYQVAKHAGVDFAKALRAMLDGQSASFQDRQAPSATIAVSMSQELTRLLTPEPAPV